MKKYYILAIIFNFFSIQSSDFTGYFSDSSGSDSSDDERRFLCSPDVTDSPCSMFKSNSGTTRRILFVQKTEDILSRLTLAVESTPAR